MKKFLKIVLSIVIISTLLIAGAGFFLTRGLDEGRKLAIGNLKLSTQSDGEYSGKYNGGRWTNELLVTVMNNRITDIKIKKDVLFPNPEVTKELFSRVIKSQSLNVDTASGATVTSKAYLKAMEIALRK